MHNDDDLLDPNDPRYPKPVLFETQIVLSIAVGVISLLAFCILRLKWSKFYAMRSREGRAAAPALPDSLFGWIPVLYNLTEDEVLHAAGLDGYVFLSFFTMAIKFLSVSALLACIIIAPIQYHYSGGRLSPKPPRTVSLEILEHDDPDFPSLPDDRTDKQQYMWAYVVFVYLFTGLALTFLYRQTVKVTRIRQRYLADEQSIAERTIRLSGIPSELQSENALRETIHSLQIGDIEQVSICRDWQALDRLMDEREKVLREVEEAWTVYLGHQPIHRDRETLPIVQPRPPEPLFQDNDANLRVRPRITLGPFGFGGKQVDAITHFTVKLKEVERNIIEARKKQYAAVGMGFVTFKTMISAQVAAQTALDPRHKTLLAHGAPAPQEVVWQNTYLSRAHRVLRSWVITFLTTALAILWIFPIGALATLLNIESIRKVWPALAEALLSNRLGQALVQGVLPTLAVTIFNAVVPFIYDWLSSAQGFISQNQVERSVVRKSSITSVYSVIKDTTKIATLLAKALEELTLFFEDYILLQGVGLFPLRLLQLGSIAVYPIYRMGAKTPRDYEALETPVRFSYGFYLPQPLFIFIICICYSVLSWRILLIGLIYFIFGYYTYKYQLLYAMDRPQHSTGQIWSIIFYRVILGVVFFHLTMAGTFTVSKAYILALTLIPLPFITIIFAHNMRKDFGPMIKHVALLSIARIHDLNLARSNGAHEDSEKYVHPNLCKPLRNAWIEQLEEMYDE